MAKDKQKKKTTDPAVWQQRFENRKFKMAKMFEDTQKYYDIMYAVQKNPDKISPWRSKVYVPVLASKAWDLIARMSDVVPYFNVTIKNELDIDDSGNFQLAQGVEERQKRIEAKLHYDYLSGHDEPMKLKVFDPLVDAVVAGTGYAYAPWCLKDKAAYGRTFDEQGTMNNKQRVAKKQKVGYNEFEGINFYNVFPADGPSWNKMPYLIVRGYKTKGDLEDTGLYKNLNQASTTARTTDLFQTFNQSRNRVVNENDTTWQDESVEMITYYECFERTKDGLELTTYAEGEAESGWVEIRPTSVPYWHTMYPVVPFYCRKKSFSVFGESLFENNRTLQSATNDLFNHYLDNWNLSIDSMLMYEDGSLTNDFVVEPGGEITFTGEPPKQFKFPEPNPQQLSLVMNVLNQGIDSATFSPYAAGQPNDKNDKTQGTAYGVKTITEAATTKIGFFRDNFKQSMKTVGRIWLSNLQQFSDDPYQVTRTVQGRQQPDVVMPSDFQGEVELDIDDDSMIPLSKADKRDMNDQFVNGILMLQKAAIQQLGIFKDPSDVPRFNFVEMVDDRAELFSVKDSQRYLLDNKTQIPQAQGPDVREFLNMSYKDAPDDIQAEIEKLYGFQPSAMHDTNMTHKAMQMGAEQGQIQNPMVGDQSGNQAGATQPATSGMA